jgi:O-acetyl-ADP-ribose deacetylase (regulator of RNase III)
MPNRAVRTLAKPAKRSGKPSASKGAARPAAKAVKVVSRNGKATASKAARPKAVAKVAAKRAKPPLKAARVEASASDRKISITMNNTVLELLEGDITSQRVEAIVNAANEKLALGGGVAGAIRRHGGPSIQEECNRIGGTPVGTAVVTGAGKLPFKHIIHAVGPRWGDGDEDRKLSAAVRSAMALADRHGLKSIAMPAISSGNFGFPLERAARVTLTEIHRYLQGGTKLQRVAVVLYDEPTWNTFARELRRGFR